MTVSVMITTRGRLVDLRGTCRSLQGLNPQPLEVLITIDGCTDDVVEAVKAELPEARRFLNQVGLGSVPSRDRMIREARGDLVLALDDDSYPEQVDCLARTVPFFQQRAELAVLHFPQRTDEYSETLTQTNFGSEHLTRSFANSCVDLFIFNCPGSSPDFSTCTRSRTTLCNVWRRAMMCFFLQLSLFVIITRGRDAMKSAFITAMRAMSSGAL